MSKRSPDRRGRVCGMKRAPHFGVAALVCFLLAAAKTTTAPIYTECKPSADGIGKAYMGREIAHVMGHQAADWLERPEREQEERTDLVVQALKVKPGEVI